VKTSQEAFPSMKMLPVESVPEDYPPEKATASRGAVLLVDDDEGNREVLQEIVELFGFTSKTARNAEESLWLLEHEPFDLMVTDIRMPNMDGMELLKKTKSNYPDLDIIMITGFSADYSFNDVVNAGASDIITKPINLEEIEAKINRVIRERHLRKELEQKNAQLQTYLEDLQLAKDRLEEQARRLVAALSEIEKANEVIEEQNQKILKANWELEKADKMKSIFLATVSHELRTPLNSIIGFLGLVLDDLCESREEEKTLLRDALNSSKNLLFLINNMLDLAKIEAGKVDLFLEKLDLREILEEVTSLLSIQARQKKLYLRGKSRAIPPVYADRGKVWQVLNNLLGNAIKFTEQGGIEVEARPFGRDFVEIGIKDTGIGVAPEQKEHIFERFVQADRNYTRKRMGTGLGLVISRNLVEMMGGTIRFESAGEGQGSQIAFTLPVSKDGQTHHETSGTDHFESS
jgi:signal transduction histidine kinase